MVGIKDLSESIMSIEAAQSLATKMNLDLVKIVPNAQPPVCRIMDYGKYCFEMRKKEREAKKKQKVIEIKEIRLSMGIGENDLETKANHAKRFLQAGNKVKVVLRFRGREMMHTKLGEDLLQKFADACVEFGAIEKAPRLDSRNMLMFLTAKNSK